MEGTEAVAPSLGNLVPGHCRGATPIAGIVRGCLLSSENPLDEIVHFSRVVRGFIAVDRAPSR